MEIQIVKIDNGWIVTTRTAKGQQAHYCFGWKEVQGYLIAMDVPKMLKALQQPSSQFPSSEGDASLGVSDN